MISDVYIPFPQNNPLDIIIYNVCGLDHACAYLALLCLLLIAIIQQRYQPDLWNKRNELLRVLFGPKLDLGLDDDDDEPKSHIDR